MIEIEKPTITKVIDEDGRYGKFVVEPLERGYGITLGNSLRRVLLSSLPGVAVTSVKIDGVHHELSTIPGVESVENSNEFVEAINGIKGTVKTFSVWIIVIFAIISLFIISNTIKLTVHNRRKEINIMKYVGATDSYIRGPFIMEGMLVGIVSAIVAFFISRLTYLGLMSSMGSASFMSAADFMPFSQLWGILLASYLILGAIIGAFGSSISVRRYLKV